MITKWMRKSHNHSQIKAVGIAGSMRRIGATTQAIQIVKYLKLMGYKACYVEMSHHQYLEKAAEYYQGIKTDQQSGKIVIEDVEMYPGSRIVEVYKKEYDFLVKDYGSFTDDDFEKISFMEQETKIFICGAKADESKYTENLLYDEGLAGNGYIFSFVTKSDRETIMENMEEKGEITYFVDYVPDPFAYVSTANAVYRALLEV